MKRARPALDATSIRAMQSIYAAAMLEELKLFQVADRLVELFHSFRDLPDELRVSMRIPSSWREQPARVLIVLFLALGSLAALFGPSIVAHMKLSADPRAFNDDARQQIAPFFRYEDPKTAPHNDYAADYFLDCLPIGYRGLYTLGAMMGNATAVSKIVPYVLLAVVLAAVGLSAARWGGVVAAWFSMALCLSSNLFLSRMVGGLPRAFAFPFLALTALYLVHGKTRWLCAVICIGAAFYPAAALAGGLALALVMCMPAKDRGDAETWTWKKRLAVVVGTGLISAVILAPPTLLARRYGPQLTPDAVTHFQEAGPGGRYNKGDRAPFPNLIPAIREEAPAVLQSGGTPLSKILDRKERAKAIPWVLALAALGLIGWGLLDAAARRLGVLALSSALGYVVACFIAPRLYLPQRYVAYVIPIFAVIALPAAAALLARPFCRFGKWQVWARAGTTLLAAVAFLVLLGGRGPTMAGLSMILREGTEKHIYDFLKTLPPNSLVAGWPRGPMDNVPYVARRTALVTFETHQAFHRGFAEEMRRRMRALIDAYFAPDLPPLSKLREQFRVTHLLVDRRHLEGQVPEYFRPFNDWVQKAYGHGKKQGFETLRQIDHASVFSEGSFVVLDLDRLVSPPRSGEAQR